MRSPGNRRIQTFLGGILSFIINVLCVLFHDKKRHFPYCNGGGCATQHAFLRHKKTFRIMKKGMEETADPSG
jgi:hypothetical protein